MINVKLSLQPDFLQSLDQNTIVLTPNRRLAATLHKLYQQQQWAKGLISWQTPTILPIHHWFQQMRWQNLLFQKQYL